MAKIQDLFFVQSGNNQLKKGKSLIHRCCGQGMTRIENYDPWHDGSFYVVLKKDAGK